MSRYRRMCRYLITLLGKRCDRPYQKKTDFFAEPASRANFLIKSFETQLNTPRRLIAKMLALDILKKPEILTPKPICVVAGDDVFLRSESINIIARAVFPNPEDRLGLSRKSGESASLADVLDELCTPSFFSDRRMVVLDPADDFVSNHRAQLEKYAEKPAHDAVLVLAVKSFPASTRLAKIIAKNAEIGVVIDANAPKEAELASWIIGRAILHQAKIERDAAVLMVELIGPETGLIDMELEKLAVACHDGKKSVIRREDVARYVHSGHVESVWTMIELAATGQAAKALEYLDSLLGAGEHPIKLIAAMASNLRKLHHAGMLRFNKMEAAAAFKEAGMFTFPKAIDMAVSQHKHLGPTRVRNLPAILLQADLDLKGWSEMDDRTIMERLILKLATPRRD